MITHERCREELSAWLDGELSRGRAAEIRAHLDGCAACSGHLAQLRRVSEDVRSLPRETMPAELKASILTAARRGTARSAVTWRGPFALSSLAAAAVLVLAVVVWQRSGIEPPPARSMEQERAAAEVHLDDGKLAFNKQAVIAPEKKAGESSSRVEGLGADTATGKLKELAKPAPAAPPASGQPAAVAGRLDKNARAGAGESFGDARHRASAAAGASKTAPQEFATAPQQNAAAPPNDTAPTQDEEIARQEKVAQPHYAAVMLESPGSLVLLADPVPVQIDALSAIRTNEADEVAGLKGKADEPSGARDLRAQAQAAPTAGAPAAAPARPRMLLLVQVDAQGVIRDLEVVDPAAIEATRAARIRSLLTGRTLPGLAPGARTAILELTIQKQP